MIIDIMIIRRVIITARARLKAEEGLIHFVLFVKFISHRLFAKHGAGDRRQAEGP